MSKLTKNQKLALGKIEAGKAYTLKEASALVKEITTTKFDASVDVDVRLGVDPRKANQMVRGVVSLPHGTGKQVRVLALCTPDKEAEATAAGADYVGLDAYKGDVEDAVDISLVREGGELIVTLIDHGIAFDPTLRKDPDITLSAEDRPIGGLGIFLIKKIMDEVSYQRVDERNVFIMKKKITE